MLSFSSYDKPLLYTYHNINNANNTNNKIEQFIFVILYTAHKCSSRWIDMIMQLSSL